ncbi:MAG TPA: ABC transporter permease [Bryobacteraceae bacterium]|jgi:predicted permease|nr:ABC transporter permease [Bryobacteraceae bacterium]
MPWHTRLRNVFRAQRLNEDLDSELTFHLAETADRLIAEGVPEEEAWRQARRRMGNYSIQKERARDMNIAGWLEAARADLSYGLRQLKLNPGFATVAVLSLALGIGANTAIFQLLDAIRLSGLPVKDPGQLVTIARGGNPGDFFTAGSYTSREEAFTYAQMEELRKHQHAFSEMLTFWPTQFNLSETGRSRYAEGLLVSSNFLDVLGVTPIAGRGLSADDDKIACSSGSAVLSYGFWQREFGGNLNVIGKNISLNGHRFPIGGITPSSFFGVEPGERFDVALPLCADNVFAKDGKGRAYDKMAYWLTAIARLKPAWSVERASMSVRNLSPAIFRETVPAEYRPDFVKSYLKNKLEVISASAGVSALRRQFANPLWILMAITGSVLLIACANLANLLLARASAREREIAVRQAVGASRPRLMMQLLTESLLLAAAGTVLGMCLAQVLSRTLVAFLNTTDNSVAVPVGLNWHMFGFLAGSAVLTCLLFGLAPAIRASGGAPVTAMHGGRTSTAPPERSSLRRTLVVAQVALSLVLLVAALLFGRSLQKLLSTNLGFDSHNVLVASVTASGPDFESPEKRKVLFRELEERLKALGGVASAATVAFTPFSGFGWNGDVHADNDPARTGGKDSWFNRAGPGYFATMGTPLLAGRDFNSHDDLNAPKVALVNQSFAKRFFAGKNPVGRSFRVEELAGKPDSIYEIIGLVGDTRYNDLREHEPDIAFFPAAQNEQPGNNATFVIRGRESLDSLESAIQRETIRLNSNLLVDFRVLDVQIRQSVLRERLMANLSVAFGILAGCLSTLGLYGVMSYIVVRRRNEIGVRVALGASRSNVYRLIAKDAGIMVAGGLALGIFASLFLSRYAESLLFELKARDPFTLALATTVLTATAAIATLLPARRAAHLEPITALREE